MLLPALNKARSKARTIQCTNNLKTVMLASLMYTDAYNGRGPAHYVNYPGFREFTWMNLLEYCKLLPERSEACRCPSLKIASTRPDKYGTKDQYYYYGAYGMILRVSWKNFPNMKWSPARDWQGDFIKTPSHIITYSDSVFKNDFTMQSYYIQGNKWGNLMHLRHNQQAQAAFLDGHVGSIQKNEIYSKYGLTAYALNEMEINL
jgi:prepilin-type processing-associated H-X9-DG protein